MKMSQKVGAKTKGWLKNNVTGEKIPFLFNPTSLAYSRGVTYTDISSPGMCYPDTQFVKGEIRTFPAELYLYDKPFTGKINKQMIFIGALLTPENNLKGYKRPPDFTFCMGFFIRKCVLAGLDINIIEFDDKGNPVEATFTLQIRQVGV